MKRIILFFCIFLSAVTANNARASDDVLFPASESGERGKIVVQIHIESEGVIEPRIDSIYLVSETSATEEEKRKNRALIQSGIHNPERHEASGHSTSVRVSAGSIEIEVNCDKFSDATEIRRSLSISVPFLEKYEAEKAGIKIKVEWIEKGGSERTGSG